MPNNLGFVEKVNWLMKKYKLLQYLITQNKYTPPYKSYVAELTQSSGGTGNPVTAVEIVNEFGSAGSWTHNNVGTYGLTFDPTGVLVNFNTDKVFMTISLTDGSGYDATYNLSLSGNNYQIYLLARRAGAFVDDSLNKVIVEIRVYN